MTTNNRRPKPANNNRPQQARPSNYEFLPYAGTGTEVVDDLAPGVAPSWRLLEIAKWHDGKHAGRNRTIAARLRAVAAEQDDERVAA
ncbi:hypothetical protein QWJ46_00425 [Rhizobium sp. CBN3]|uniref:hypothetical protein n=1 Tax=Rhizobium sp. CBN3 TaxID=3058045 RepID=UPI0026722487|nr:hypothetical protein [Rhizobium sp. CBN3]MDO3431138.1 hypothetical protein [Rhizobium sp. CBN3]